MSIAGVTSTGSKRPDILFGPAAAGVPHQMVHAHGCTVHGTDGREYLDFIMGLGAVALGYGNAAVNLAVHAAVDRGATGPLPPADEAAFADELRAVIPQLEEVRFLKTGAEAVAAAVRIAHVATGRDQVLGCGYHGWLDWCNTGLGTPQVIQSLFGTVPFNDAEGTRKAIRAAGDRLACVVVEPVIDAAPDAEWLTVLRTETQKVGALLVIDEIKTACRIALGGATEVWQLEPDLIVLGKAIANGYPLAVVGGRADVMRAVQRTWISSTLATESVSLAAARATVAEMKTKGVPAHLGLMGARLFSGLTRLASEDPTGGVHCAGIPQMCYLRYADNARSQRVAAECARRGLLFKRTAYNFVSLAHDASSVDSALKTLGEVLATC